MISLEGQLIASDYTIWSLAVHTHCTNQHTLKKKNPKIS